MMKHALSAAVLIVVLGVSLRAATGQPASGASGHWQGAIQAPGQELKCEVDLAPAGDKWEGTITIPAQGIKGLALSAISVEGERVSFAIKNAPGNPQFTGKLSTDGKGLSGELSQGGGSVPFSLTRTGDAKIERYPASTPVIKEMEGSWEGVLDVGGTTLRLALKLANQPGGPATGTLVSVDQGAAEIPIVSVIQAGTHLKLLLPLVGGDFDGELKDGQLTGTWTQGANSWPLTFKRSK